MRITIGIDIGQSVDPTAIAVVEQEWRKREPRMEGLSEYVDHYNVRHLERLGLGTPYPDIMRALARLKNDVDERVMAGRLRNEHGEITPDDVAVVKCYIDATAMGAPVVDILREAGVSVIGCIFLHSERRTVDKDAATGRLVVKLGKAYMVSRLQVLLQNRRIHMDRKMEEARRLAKELLDYQIKVDENARDRFGAFGTGKHDDLVTALGLAVQESPIAAGALASSRAGFASSILTNGTGEEGVQQANRIATLQQRRSEYDKYSGFKPPSVGYGNGIGIERSKY
jgi:hypothetical protein